MSDTPKFIYEIGVLKRVARSGWWLAGIKDPETVAEHSFRTAILSYVLAGMEGLDPERCACMSLFHDIRETRLTDLHKVSQRYVTTASAEERVTADQLARLPAALAARLQALLGQYAGNDSPEATVAHDADLLECLIQAIEYRAQGYSDVQEWIDSCRAKLRSASAKALAEDCLALSPSKWWDGLKS